VEGNVFEDFLHDIRSLYKRLRLSDFDVEQSYSNISAVFFLYVHKPILTGKFEPV